MIASMHKFILFIKEFRIYNKKELENAISSFSKKQFLIFIGFLSVAIISVVIILAKINSMFLVDIPVSGGEITEGIVGVSTLVNPILAISDGDKDLTSLVYSGLMRKTVEGTFIPDLAESYQVSPDGMSYTFKIKDNIKFHNGDNITADDIIFTFEKIKDPLIKSPRKMEWNGVNIRKQDDYTVVFTLTQPYISFMDNTTVGILPSTLWKNIDASEFNLSPLNTTKAIGSGPYKIESVIKDDDGIPKKYELERFNNFSLGKPMIKRINIISFTSEKDLIKALLDHSIDQAGGISSKNIEDIKNKNYVVHMSVLPRIFGIFFNSNNNKIFNDPSIISAINKTIDRQDIVDQVLGGYGSIIFNPVPEKIVPNTSKPIFNNSKVDEARLILDKAGWKVGDDGIRTKGGITTKSVTKKLNVKMITQLVKNTENTIRLSFSLITGDTPELRQTTILVKEQLEKIGIEVNIDKIYETGQLNQLIRDRNYEALFFGQIINHEYDLYSFWHKSQQADPGLNIAMYNNSKVDLILESIQKTFNIEERMKKYKDLVKEFEKNIPAFLIYSPKYLYVTSPKLNNIYLPNMTLPADRFISVYKWSVDKEKVWKIFSEK